MWLSPARKGGRYQVENIANFMDNSYEDWMGCLRPYKNPISLAQTRSQRMTTIYSGRTGLV